MTVTISIVGGLVSEPELRYSTTGLPIASGTVASTDRYRDRESGEWKDGKSLYVRWSAFKDLAENIAASQLQKGTQVTVTGKLVTRTYEDRDGQKRSSTDLEVTDFAVSLRRATAQLTRSQKPQQAAGESRGAPPAEEWATAPIGDDTPF